MMAGALLAGLCDLDQEHDQQRTPLSISVVS